MEKRFLSAEETAQALGVARITVYQMIRRKEIPSLKIGGKRLVPVSFLHDLERRALAVVRGGGV